MSLTLLPSGGFEVAYGDKVIKGQFSAAALKKLALKNGGLGFSDTVKLLTDNASLQSLLQFVQCALIGEYDEFDVLEIFEQLGGIDSEDSQKLFGHFMDGFVSKKKVTEQNL